MARFSDRCGQWPLCAVPAAAARRLRGLVRPNSAGGVLPRQIQGLSSDCLWRLVGVRVGAEMVEFFFVLLEMKCKNKSTQKKQNSKFLNKYF